MPPHKNHRRTAKWLLLLCLLGVITCVSLASMRLWGLFLNSLWLTFGTLAVSLPVGTFLAVAITKTSILGRHAIKGLMVTLLLVPLFVQATAWQAALGQTGWLYPGTNHDFALSGWYGAIWIHGMGAIAWVVLCVGAALKNVPRELEEETLQDSNAWRVLWYVSLRRALAGVAVAGLWIGVICFGEITVTDLFQVRTFAEEIYTTANLGFFIAPNALPTESTLLMAHDLWIGTALLVLLVLAALVLVGCWIPWHSMNSASNDWTLPLRRSRWALTIVAWLLTTVIVGVPLLSLLGKAGFQSERVDQRVESSWSAKKAVTLIARSPWEHRREGRWSFTIGGLAAVSATIVGVFIAWGLRTHTLPPLPTTFLLALSFAIPGPLLGIWVIRLLNQPDGSIFGFLNWWYDHTIIAPVFVQFLRGLPLTTIVLIAQFASIPQDVLDSARSEGAHSKRLLWSIVLPQSWPALLAAACMALMIAIGDMAATLLVLPPGVSTLSTRIFGLLHYGAEDRVSALCFALALGLGLWAIMTWRLLRNFKTRA